MKTLAIICNVLFWGFFCLVMMTDGPAQGADMFWSLIPFVMPILNVAVIRVVSSPSRTLKLVTLAGNVVWLGLACWLIIDRYPSHPREEGLIAYVGLMALTPLLSAVAVYLSLRAPGPALPK